MDEAEKDRVLRVFVGMLRRLWLPEKDMVLAIGFPCVGLGFEEKRYFEWWDNPKLHYRMSGNVDVVTTALKVGMDHERRELLEAAQAIHAMRGGGMIGSLRAEEMARAVQNLRDHSIPTKPDGTFEVIVDPELFKKLGGSKL